MNETWHIPRASLSGGSSASGSSNSSNKSHSNPSTVTRHSRQLRQEGHTNFGYLDYDKKQKQQKNSQLPRDDNKLYKGNSDLRHYSTAGRASNQQSSTVNGGVKRGSRSSQGSTDSNSSSHSAASGSLLLTVANLERFAAIHKNHPTSGSAIKDIHPKTHQNYNTNIRISHHPDDIDVIGNNKNDTIIAIDPNLHFVKTKDVDTMSIASSTHFTMVNGMGGPQRKSKNGICSRGHQITVLILSMSMVFLIGILAAVYLLEMRAREMPH